ncbi:two-component sensor histidine kinase [Rhizobium rhizosphaerae]|uniref:C4-dicarboxylate transport sensor protein n=1 Tax=Xaviernesmea rhizosphaerae TaxID=1672749 RepID=A0ABX3PHB3_9HYPH|nr:two-component sensor histidine kinase [Xaviernesmea rhizosphaerae]
MLSKSRLKIWLLVLPVLAVAALVWSGASLWSRREAAERLAREAETLARQHGRLIDSELARFRLMPIVLGEYGDLVDALSNRDRETATRLSDKLGFLVRETGASYIYLINRDGVAVSASNVREPTSFVGQDFGFRPYFNEAMRDGAAEYYGAGLLTRRAGLFLARRVGESEAASGVVVVKYEFGALSASWASDPGRTLVVDANGIILAAPDEDQILTTLAPLPAAVRQQIDRIGQYGDAALEQGKYRFAGPDRIVTAEGARMIYASLPIAGTDLRLLHLLDSGPARAAADRRAALATLAILPLLLLASFALWWRAHRAARRAAERRALEEAVAERTAQLREEMGYRALADQRYREAREELAQANRLASVGSIAAGLMHEINQPVATIRTLSENALHHLAASRSERVRDSLGTMIAMTERIGTLTQEMRGFARRGEEKIGPQSLDAIISGAMLLMEDRIAKAGIRLDRSPSGQPSVLGKRVPLEQVLVNLLQNAMDALEAVPDARIAMTVERRDETIRLMVADNGPGIDPALGKDVFQPFVTGKPNGLGLGLGIAEDIMRDVGGALEITASPLGGAAFTVTMRTA